MFGSNKKQELKEGLQFEQEDLDALPNMEKDKILNILKWQGQGFDTRVHIVDPNSGQLLKYQPFRRQCSQNEGVIYFRRDESGIERRYSEQGHCLDRLPSQAPQMKVPHGNDQKRTA